MTLLLFVLAIAPGPIDALKARPPPGCTVVKREVELTRNAALAVEEMKRDSRPTHAITLDCRSELTAINAWQLESPAAVQVQLDKLALLMWGAAFSKALPRELLLYKGNWLLLFSGSFGRVVTQLCEQGGFFIKGEPLEDVSAEQLAEVRGKADCARASWACDALDVFAKGAPLTKKQVGCRVGVALSVLPGEDRTERPVFLCVTPALLEAGPLESSASKKDEEAQLLVELKAAKKSPVAAPIVKMLAARPKSGNARRDLGASSVARGATAFFFRQTSLGIVGVIAAGPNGQRAVALYP